MIKKTAIIIGGGPAGLTAAFELASRTDIRPIVFEADNILGGISRTVNYKGNRIDLGGHRFFSKSDRVMDWWRQVLPLQGFPSADQEVVEISYQNKKRLISLSDGGPDPRVRDEVMLIRPRVSRILFGGQFFDYPLKPTLKTLKQLGVVTSSKILASYARSQLVPVKPEKSLEDFVINRFGKELYETFFRDYTEKVWGVPCSEIPAAWGAQRIKGLSVANLIKHAAKSVFGRVASVDQKGTETSLIEQFMYPKHGPGQLWEQVAGMVKEYGGDVSLRNRVTAMKHSDGRIQSVTIQGPDGESCEVAADWFFTTMPIRDLIKNLSPEPPRDVLDVAEGLVYRDFMTVGLLLDRLKLGGNVTGRQLYGSVPDNWIYIQEPGVKVGRLQIFNNWSPYMVADPDQIWIGLEYFVNEGDEFWRMPDDDMVRFAVEEMERIGVIDKAAVRDHTVIRMPKAYPAYFGTYGRFDTIREYLNQFSNLYALGRNGMHRYNNQDHSMLTAMTAVDGIISNNDVHEKLWEINTEQEYHEER